MANFTLEITSLLNGTLFKGECNLAVIPGSTGDLGVMHDHESVITTLREGTITVFDDKQNLIKSFDVKGGFAKMITEDRLSVVVE